MRSPQPILTAPLFAPLHDELIALLRGLRDDEWSAPTAAGAWTVRDVAAHLLDTAIRRLSLQRDGHVPPGVFEPNETNREWVVAARRLSPRMVIELMERYGRENAEYLASLDPHATAQWNVAWAGDEESPVWFDVARELTERWHHQQQIRDATGRPPLYDRYLAPVIATFVRALPHTYRDVDAPAGTAVAVRIDDGAWTLVLGGQASRLPAPGVPPGADDRAAGRGAEAGETPALQRWTLYEGAADGATTTVSLPGDRAWRLFTKQKIDPRAEVTGDARYAEPILGMTCIIG